jgi:hypothetical protein
VIAREISVPGETLHQFAHASGPLPPEKLKALCEYLYGNHVTYDAELDQDHQRHAAAARVSVSAAVGADQVSTAQAPDQRTGTGEEATAAAEACGVGLSHKE